MRHALGGGRCCVVPPRFKRGAAARHVRSRAAQAGSCCPPLLAGRCSLAATTRCPFPAADAGATSVSDPLKLSRVTNPQELLYTLLAVSHAPQPELLLSGACRASWWKLVGGWAMGTCPANGGNGRGTCCRCTAAAEMSGAAAGHAPRSPLRAAVNVAGFIYVQDVDLAKGTITYLAPCAGALPGQLLLAGAFKAYLD